MRSLTSLVLPSGLLALTLLGCGNGGADGSVVVGITAQALQSTAPIQATSGEAEPRHLVVTVTEVSLRVEAPSADIDTPGAPAASRWITASSGKTRVDLLDAAVTEAILGSIAVPAGTITQVRLVLTDAKLVDGATRTAIACPSCSASGFTISIEDKVEVPAGAALHLALDFDQTKSLSESDSGYQLAPVITIADPSGG